MPKSIHIIKKNFKGLTKVERDKQAKDLYSELNEWGSKKFDNKRG